MNYHIKQQNDKWVVYTTGRTHNQWVFDNKETAQNYLKQCKGETA